jgi:uncharacterized protein
MLDPIDIISEYYLPGTPTYRVLIDHGRRIRDTALAAAERVPHLNPDLDFIRQAAMLHDIGIFLTHAAKLGCHGKHPYVSHGYLGRELLEKKGLPRHALVCERHVGAGITVQDIRDQDLPLPERDMVPVSIEEQIICYADKFYSKIGPSALAPKPVSEIIEGLMPFGLSKVERFKKWLHLFNGATSHADGIG